LHEAEQALLAPLVGTGPDMIILEYAYPLPIDLHDITIKQLGHEDRVFRVYATATFQQIFRTYGQFYHFIGADTHFYVRERWGRPEAAVDGRDLVLDTTELFVRSHIGAALP
jgi:hypothetical protein